MPCIKLRASKRKKVEKLVDSYSYIAVFYWKQKPLPQIITFQHMVVIWAQESAQKVSNLHFNNRFPNFTLIVRL